MANKQNLIGKRFGKLVVKEEFGRNKKGNVIWTCLCDCGKLTYKTTAKLNNGSKNQSCGCTRCPDLTNQRFGFVTVLGKIGIEEKSHRAIWNCLCDCGNIVPINTHNLKLNKHCSCGCMRVKSNGEEKVMSILNDSNIDYKMQKTFADCRFNDTNKLAIFDFYLMDYYIVEYDGNLHFKEGIKKSGWNNYEHYIETVKHDKFKNAYCKEHNIPLIRIPYTHFDDLCIEDLLLETTQFRVV